MKSIFRLYPVRTVLALLLVLMIAFLLPGIRVDKFEIAYGYPLPFLSLYPYPGEDLSSSESLLSQAGVNLFPYLIDSYIIAVVLNLIVFIYRKIMPKGYPVYYYYPAPPPNAAYYPAPPPNTAYYPAPPPNTAYYPAPPPNTAYYPAPPPNTAYYPAPPPNTAYYPAPPNAAYNPAQRPNTNTANGPAQAPNTINNFQPPKAAPR